MAGRKITVEAKVNPALPFLSFLVDEYGVLLGWQYLNGQITWFPASVPQAGITAAVGSTQETGVELLYRAVEIEVCANAGDAVTMPYAKPGMCMSIVNHGAEAADVFPASGDAFNGVTADAAFALPADKPAIFYCVLTGVWEVLIDTDTT